MIRRKFLQPLLAVLLVLCCAAAHVGAEGSETAHNSAIRLPLGLLHLGEQAQGSAPALLTAARELERAQSDFRSRTGQVWGTSFSLDAPTQVRDKGAGTSVQLSLRQAAGPLEANATVGLAAAYEWEASWKLGPTVTLGVKLPLPSDADVRTRTHELELERAEVRYRNAERNWKLALVQGYRDVLLAQYDKDIAALKLTEAQMELERAEVRGAAGAESAAALHAARQGVAKAEAGLVAADLRLEQALFHLAQVTGSVSMVPPAAEDEYAVRKIDVAPAADSAEAWIQLALARRDDVRLAEATVALAYDELQLAQRKAGLTGELTGGVSLPASSSEPERIGWYVGAAFTMPLLDVATAEAVNKAEIAYAQAVADRDALLERIEGDVRFAYRQLELAEAVYRQAVAGAEYAAQLLVTAEEAASSGVGTPAEVVSAQVTLAQAERDVVAAYFDLIVRRVTLWHLVGGDFSW